MRYSIMYMYIYCTKDILCVLYYIMFSIMLYHILWYDSMLHHAKLYHIILYFNPPVNSVPNTGGPIL